ncbi:MAG: segregation and condensation protein A [Armatimonadota bacterium]
MSRFTGYPVALPVFEGPLDLLLYLIRRQEIDIYDIPIAAITAQFLDYLTLMESLDIELAADFLVMAATLLEIKSRMLLPRPPLMEVEEVEEIDPRAELVRRLLEYQQFKSAAGELSRRAEEQKFLFARTAVVPNLSFLKPDPALLGDPDAFSLWTALQEVLARLENAGPLVREVVRPKLTIRQQMLHIIHLLEASPQGVPFTQLFWYDGRDTVLTRLEVIVTFLAMLELMRLHRLQVVQKELFEEITLKLIPAESRIN